MIVPTRRYDSRHIKKAEGQKTLMGTDTNIFLIIQKVRLELDKEINSLGITEDKIIEWRHGGSVIDWKKITPDQKERLHKQQGLLTARTIFSLNFEELLLKEMVLVL